MNAKLCVFGYVDVVVQGVSSRFIDFGSGSQVHTHRVDNVRYQLSAS
jgi:hypothetical protein